MLIQAVRLYLRLSIEIQERIESMRIEKKRCAECGIEQPYDNFHKNIRESDRLQRVCKSCRSKHKRRLAQTDYDALLAKQEGKCAICGTVPEAVGRKFTVDHAHADQDEQPRGLLCNHCNVAIGLMNEDVSILISAIGYLQKNQTLIVNA